jgi:hypothetical protein
MKAIQGECCWTLEGTTQLQGRGPSLVSMTTYQDNKAIREVGSSKLSPFLIVKQINVMAFQFKFPSSMKIHHVFHVSLLEF